MVEHTNRSDIMTELRDMADVGKLSIHRLPDVHASCLTIQSIAIDQKLVNYTGSLGSQEITYHKHYLYFSSICW